MASELVLTNASVVLGAPLGDISAKVKSVTVTDSPAMLDDTAMGDTGKSRCKGLSDWTVDIEVYQDFTDEEFDEDCWTLVDAGTPLTVAIKPAVGTTGAANPAYTGTGIIDGYVPIGGEVGALQIVKLKIVACGTKLTRAVS